MRAVREMFAEMFNPRTLWIIIYVLATVVSLKAMSVYFGFSWLQALAAQ